jgi:hypothetical protein
MMGTEHEERAVYGEVIVPAGIDDVWMAWDKVVLPRLVYRFQHGPIDWQNRPDLSAGG